MIKKLLFILPALLLSSTVQINAMQDDNIQLHLQNNNEQILNEISDILDKFQLDKTKKEEILSNINKINDKYALYWIHNVIKILPEETEETLFNIIKEKINNISTLRETASLFSDMIKNNETNNMFSYAIKSINQMSNYRLYALSKVFDILSEEEITEGMFFNISTMNKDALVNLYLVLYYLKDTKKTEDILLKICSIDKDTLRNLYNVLYRIQYKVQSYITQDILHNISEMNKYTLSYLSSVLYIINKFKITTYNLLDISRMGGYQLQELYEELCDQEKKKMKNNNR